MMEKKQVDNSWHLVRNDNGECISEENVVFISHIEAGILQVRAAKNGKQLSVQYGPDGSLWCYKHGYEEIEALEPERQVTTIRKLKIERIMEKKNKKDIYYDRAMSPNLEAIILKDFKWLIDEVIANPELDFQTGSNENDSWFSVYRGTGRVLTIKETGKIFAAPKYMALYPSFYTKPDKRGVATLLRLIQKDGTLGRYYIGADGKKKEGYYQNLISRRYSLFCEPEDDFIIIDKEFVLGGYHDEKAKETISSPIIKKYDGIIRSLSETYEYCKNIKQSGTECDFVGLTRQGDIMLLELKRHEDTTKIYLSPLQAGKYEDLTKEYARRYSEDFNRNVINMVTQKINMGILKPKWPVPTVLSGKIFPAVVVGGNASKEAKKRFNIVRDAVGKDIALYTCDEKGKLIGVL